MKHLKSYNESQLSNAKVEAKDIVQNLKDICIELEDEGFKIFLQGINPHVEIHLGISKGGEDFKYGEVSEVVERMKDYMKQEGYSAVVKKPNPRNAAYGHVWGIGITDKLLPKKYKSVYTSISMIFTHKQREKELNDILDNILKVRN